MRGNTTNPGKFSFSLPNPYVTQRAEGWVAAKSVAGVDMVAGCRMVYRLYKGPAIKTHVVNTLFQMFELSADVRTTFTCADKVEWTFTKYRFPDDIALCSSPERENS